MLKISFIYQTFQNISAIFSFVANLILILQYWFFLCEIELFFLKETKTSRILFSEIELARVQSCLNESKT